MIQYYECPKCGCEDFGDKILGGDLEQDHDTIWKEYECECGFSWQEIYVFSHNETTDGSCEKLDNGGRIII